MSVSAPSEFPVGTPTEFSVSVVAGDKAGTMVKGSSSGVDDSKLSKFEYFEPQDGQYHELKGDSFGPSSGFPLMDATSKFQVTFKEACTMDVTFYLKSVEDGSTVVEIPATFKSV